MKTNYVLLSLIIMIVMFVGGLVLLLSSTTMGQQAGSKAIRIQGGAMDTHSYDRIVDSTTDSYRTAGMVVSLVGGFGVLLSGFGYYKELEG